MIALTLWGCGSGPVAGDPAGEGGPADPAGCEVEAPRLLRRLTHAEYAASVLDVVGVAVDPGAFAADTVVDGFRNDAAALVVGDLLADQYRATAEAIGGSVDPWSLAPCDRAARGDAACAGVFVEELGFELFRRPLSADELAEWGGLWSELAAEDGADEALRWVLIGMLQSPHFLYRSELGVQGAPGVFSLTNWELATALSYGLLGTTPSRALLDRVSDGLLSDPADVPVVAGEMLADPLALRTMADQVEAWLDLSQLATVSRDGLTPELRDQMAAQLRDRVTTLAEADGTLAELVELGLLVEPSVLTTHGKPTGSGPVQRGVFVRERLLCEDLPPPPSNLDVSPPEVDPALSTRDRYAQHASDPQCSGCHAQIDPLGFAFEHYDQLGRWRDTDDGHPVDDSGDLDGVSFVGPEGLASALLADPRFRTCFASTWRRQVTGRPACAPDPGPDVTLFGPLAEIPTLPDFGVRSGGADEGDTWAVGVRSPPDEPVEPPPADDGASSWTVTDDWGAGYCAEGAVTNATAEDWTWTAQTPADGVVDNVWNAVLVESGADFVFAGADWNAVLPPGGEATFGFCAHR